MKKSLFVLLLVSAVGCSQNPTVQSDADSATCRNVEPRLGTNIPRRDDCTVVTAADRDAAKAEAEAVRENQMRRTMPRPTGGMQ